MTVIINESVRVWKKVCETLSLTGSLCLLEILYIIIIIMWWCLYLCVRMIESNREREKGGGAHRNGWELQKSEHDCMNKHTYCMVGVQYFIEGEINTKRKR